jgi:hypothetical protein
MDKKLKMSKECEHDECAECHHLIAKGSGQVVTEIYPQYFNYSFTPYEAERRVIFCDLHKKPYDWFNRAWALWHEKPTTYQKKVSPWKRVNEDGSDYKEPKAK